MSAAKVEVDVGSGGAGWGGALLLRAGEGISPRLTLGRYAAFVLRQDDQARHIWSWLAAEQRASGPFSPRLLAAPLTAPTVFQSLSAAKSFKRGRQCLLCTFWT